MEQNNNQIPEEMEQNNNQIPKDNTETPETAENLTQSEDKISQLPQEDNLINSDQKDFSVEFERATAELNEMKDKYLRLYADFDNYRKRVSKEKLDMYKTANEALIKQILPTLDNFERAKKSLPQMSDDLKPHLEGFNLIYENLHKSLTSFGLKEIPTAAGDVFDTDLHEAVTQIPMENMSGKIVDTIEKGYYLEDKVIRFAKVVVGA